MTALPPPARQFLDPIAMIRRLWRHRNLIGQFTRRELTGRYKGSNLGMLWPVLTPLLMLAVYTFLFSIVFETRWGHAISSSKAEYALMIFCGLIVYNLFAESIARAPGLITGNPNYVKKVIFPLEILPVALMGSGLIHAAIGLGILLAGEALFMHQLPWTIVFFPLVVLPVLMMGIGLSWFFSALGVYLRDLGHAIQIAVQVLFFLTPIFYSAEIVPAQFQPFLKINLLAGVVADARRVLLMTQPPQWGQWLVTTAISAIVLQLGYVWFMKTRRGFADVI
jgi:lipopolysaccharide transport system permease protein